MKFEVIIYLSFSFTDFCISSASEDSSSLEFVQIVIFSIGSVLFRHGERTPTSFSGAPDVISEQFSDTLGYLTQHGKQQTYSLGQFMRSRFGHLLNYSYNESQFYLHSGDDNRTSGSSLGFLSGFFPVLNPETNWHPNISWQPIPIHTDARIEDIAYMMIRDTCPRLAQNVKQSKFYQDQWKRLLPERTFVERNLRTEVDDFWTYCFTVNGLASMRQLGTEVPDWWTKEREEMLIPTTGWMPFLENVPDLLRFTSGPLVHEIVTRMSNFVSERSAHKAVAYSAHGETILGLVMALNLTAGRKALEKHPTGPFCNYMLLELHKRNGKRYVKIYFRNFTTDLPDLVKMAGCEDPCPLETFIELLLPNTITFDDFEQFCSADTERPEGVANALLVTLTVILGLAVLIMSFAYYRLHGIVVYRRR